MYAKLVTDMCCIQEQEEGLVAKCEDLNKRSDKHIQGLKEQNAELQVRLMMPISHVMNVLTSFVDVCTLTPTQHLCHRQHHHVLQSDLQLSEMLTAILQHIKMQTVMLLSWSVHS